MHAVATSPDDLFFWDCRSGRYEKRPERLLQRKEKGSSGIRVGDFDSNLLKKLGLNRWFSEEKQRGLASRVPAGLALPKCAVFRLLRDFRKRLDQPREDGEPALTPIGFGAPGLPETFLRNGEGRRTQTAGQRKERHCMEKMPVAIMRSPSSKSTGNSASDFASTSTPARWNDSSSRRGTKSTEKSRSWALPRQP